MLAIYHRLVCESRRQEKNQIYDEWLLDIPKILCLIDIYGATYPKVVKEILATAFDAIEEYKSDVFDFVEIIRTDIMDTLGRHLEFEFRQDIIKKITNFSDPIKSFNRNLIKSFYTTYEVYHTLLMYLSFFPRQYYEPLLADSTLEL